jgi:hypothetical protein
MGSLGDWEYGRLFLSPLPLCSSAFQSLRLPIDRLKRAHACQAEDDTSTQNVSETGSS